MSVIKTCTFIMCKKCCMCFTHVGNYINVYVYTCTCTCNSFYLKVSENAVSIYLFHKLLGHNIEDQVNESVVIPKQSVLRPPHYFP